MVGFEILVRVDTGKKTEFLQAFELLKRYAHKEKDRLSVDLYSSINEQDVFLWVEHWQMAEALSTYLENNIFRSMMGAIEILGQLVYKRSFSITEEAHV